MNCPHCREPLPESTEICPYCGGRQEPGVDHILPEEQSPLASTSPLGTRKLWWTLIVASSAWLVMLVAALISYEDALPKELVLYWFLGYLAFWVLSSCVWAFFLIDPRHRATYVSSVAFSLVFACVGIWVMVMGEREVEDVKNAVFEDGTTGFVDSEGNFDAWVYDRLDDVQTLTAEWARTKETIRGVIENEERFVRRFAELGEMTLDDQDYDDPAAISELINELGEYKKLADEYESTTLDYLEANLGRKIDLEAPEPYSLDEKMSKLVELLGSMRAFADISIATYAYLLSIHGEMEFDTDGTPVIESDEKREHFNALVDEQSSAAVGFDEEAQAFAAYSAEYLERLER